MLVDSWTQEDEVAVEGYETGGSPTRSARSGRSASRHFTR